MTWQAQQEPLRQLAEWLRDSLSSNNRTAQKRAELMLKQTKSFPDINNYLTFLLCTSEMPSVLSFSADDYLLVRCAAAIMLKNNVKRSYKSISQSSMVYMRSNVPLALQDANAQIRNYAGNAITEIVRQGGILGWQEILPTLMSLVENQAGNVPENTQEGAMSALLKIYEDVTKELNRDFDGQRPLNVIVPKLLQFTSSPVPKVRVYALSSINVFIPEKPQAILVNLDNILYRLFELTSDPSEEVRKHVCRSLVHIAEISPSKIFPHMSGLVDFLVAQQRSDRDPDLALDAAEFWLSVSENKDMRTHLGPYLNKIIPVLLDCMVYDEDSILEYEAEEENAECEDRDQDIKPHFAASRGTRATNASGSALSTMNGGGPDKTNGFAYEDDDISEGEIDERDEDGIDPDEQWGLRKCSAATLDVLANLFHDEVFRVSLPYLKENLTHDEWPRREAAVLALGAIAEGCMDAVQPSLPDLIPFLLSLLSDRMPVVRKITCWSLARYSSWAASLDEAGKQRFFLPMIQGLLDRMLDGHKKVQEAAASAFTRLEEKAGEALNPYCQGIVQRFAQCFAAYQDRNMFVLYECVQTLAEQVGPVLQEPELVNLIMPALVSRWVKLSDRSREMISLLECLSYVAAALAEQFTPFAAPITNRCIRLIRTNIEDAHLADMEAGYDGPDKDFLVSSLDLLSTIVQSLDSSKANELVATSQPPITAMLVFTMKDMNEDVRQSAYALLGDLAIYTYPQLRLALDELMPVIMTQLDVLQLDPGNANDPNVPVINNACWACGEIAVRHREGMAPYANELLQRLATILFQPKLPDSLFENAAIALGRLGLGCASTLAPHLASFAPPFLKAMSMVAWTDEKGHAMKGFSKIVLENPQAMEHCLVPYFVQIASAPDASSMPAQQDGPIEAFVEVLKVYREIIPDFNGFLRQLPEERRQCLRSSYQL